MNSRWQANRIGLINFWYYDDQEFSFAGGRMLLRGSNGSGKSVTMQSIIPLLLDGNLSPERLDPFGSRDRKMSGYLLEENDEREERTGYLFLEFRRKESETYLTIGMGIRARKGKPMDKWYFSLTDGRRIGRDFFLYKSTHEKIPLSKKELENKIAEGGRIFDRQQDYMAYVNQQIFGFETTDAYREMIDLLIQLRTPKLSRDFKPTVINEILSDSLQPLSDEDLRPMSEAIENMDTLNLNLKSHQEAYEAARRIHRILEQYDRLCLYEKSAQYQKSVDERQALSDEQKLLDRELDQRNRSIGALENEQAELNARKLAMEKERDSLQTSDAFSLKKRELDLVQQVETEENRLQEKSSQCEEKKAAKKQLDDRYRKEQENLEHKKAELMKILDGMQTDAEAMAFDEFVFFSDELKKQFETPFSFAFHQKLIEDLMAELEQGTELLRRAERQRRDLEELIRESDAAGRDAEQAGQRVEELDMLLAQTCNEWKESLYSWHSSSQELKLQEDTLRDMARFAEAYGPESDFSLVRHLAASAWIESDGRLDQNLRILEMQRAETADLLKEKEKELEEWEHQKEPEPSRSEAVVRNRERLKRQNIPYLEFYRLLDWSPDLDPAVCDRLEEALTQMGILDALIVEESYRDQVLTADGDGCDRYLFVQKPVAGSSLLDVLQPDNTVNDLMKNHQIVDILRGIAYQEENGVAGTWISQDGVYRIGAVTGTVTGQISASFLGSRTRERHRQEVIRECREEIRHRKEELEALQEQMAVLHARKERLRQEYESFPDDGDMQESLRMRTEAEHRAERLRLEEQRLHTKAEEQMKVLRSLMNDAGTVADRLHMKCQYEVFLRASDAARSYSRQFYRLSDGHEVYLQIGLRIGEMAERSREMEQDVSRMTQEVRSLEQSLYRQQEELRSVREQLELTDYEEIRERLDLCLEWLADYPEKLQQCVSELTRNQERILFLENRLQRGEQQIEAARRKEAYLRRIWQEEWDLKLIDLPELPEETPVQMMPLLFPKGKIPEKDSTLASLNRIYFENRGFLNDYQPELEELFAGMQEGKEPDWPSAERMHVTARYQGTRVSFRALIGHLEEDIRELQDLIRDGDRELFEDILSNIISRKIRGRINSSNAWVENMNRLMSRMDTSSGLQFSLRWRSRTAEDEDQLDTRELVDLLKKDYRIMSEKEAERLSAHFRSKVEQARRAARDERGTSSFYQIMKEILDYRKWFEFQLFFRKSGERVRELTNSMFGRFSGGEKAMAMYVPLFSAVTAKYQGGRQDAPRMIALDEAFAGVDDRNIRDMFRLMTEFEFDFIINSQVLWGDYDTLDALAVYQLIRPDNARFVTVMPYLWNGFARENLNSEQEMEQRILETEAQRSAG